MNRRSLHLRMLIGVSVLLALFFGATALVLDLFFRELSLDGIRAKLEVQSQALMAAVEEDAGRLVPAKEQLDARLLQPNSGLYAEIANAKGRDLWRSPSLLGNPLDESTKLKAGQQRLYARVLADGTHALVLSTGYVWQFEDRHTAPLVFSVAESEEPYFRQLTRFRWRLFGGFSAMAVALIVSLLLLLRWLLRPVRELESGIQSIERGDKASLDMALPSELVGVASNLNKLLSTEHARQTRYRQALGNLAHSLKTPLAVVRGLAATEVMSTDERRRLDQQLVLMDDIVRYQLKRASAMTAASIGAPLVPVREIVDSLCEALSKVYADRHIACEVVENAPCLFRGDRNDLMEMVGNILDNAFKYGHGSVLVTLSAWTGVADGFALSVSDNGPGIPASQRAAVLARGARLDERETGQGIGLSVVSELVTVYGGELVINDSPLGGACVTLRFGLQTEAVMERGRASE